MKNYPIDAKVTPALGTAAEGGFYELRLAPMDAYDLKIESFKKYASELAPRTFRLTIPYAQAGLADNTPVVIYENGKIHRHGASVQKLTDDIKRAVVTTHLEELLGNVVVAELDFSDLSSLSDEEKAQPKSIPGLRGPHNYLLATGIVYRTHG